MTTTSTVNTPTPEESAAFGAEEPAGLTTDHSRASADAAHSHGTGGTPQGSRAERLTSFDLADIPVPTGREEEWRFSPVSRIAPLFDEAISGRGVITTVVDAPEVTVEIVPRDDARLGTVGKPGDRTAVVAWNAVAEATVVTIPEGVTASDVTSIRVEGTTSDPTATHLLVHAEANSSAVVVLDHVGDATLTETVEVVVDEGAHLTLVSVQDWEDGAVHTSSHRSRIGKDARLKHVVVTFGGDVVRVTPDAEFGGEGGEVEMVGLYFADTDQHQEHRLFVDHNLPRNKSRVTYKGALQGEGAHVVWVGDVLIRAEAEGTDTYELNRNLVLTDGARADSVPNLEIETGEIEGAGHASATGRFDDEQLFYLQARGIPEADARRLVVRGFFAELIQEIGVASVEERLLASIEDELAKSMSVIEGAGA
ncbi:iron-regulated ABC transporter permease protein SufD [Sediminihabitans luteus]|uniref:Iron-regulated ABC transporter permease protein SufD n=1 Tax=Sediminihabitans luteus TaxID=1138585 RepID=A0A2M9CRA1_9CELL|nr:Fe-S cluster assembly protein SufD [Sediminihabitans luteus]PJJ74419.1 iron-regulated ABC transporter permease protein SufD [Sediminihabitans luteus]GIJ00214.1 Fe-S cluster assembly protein SufD [Sediminihabitans luteus]